MIFEIECDRFWFVLLPKIIEFYINKPASIETMKELHDHLGLEYLSTVLPYGPIYFFKFKVVDEKKFFLSKINYGI